MDLIYLNYNISIPSIFVLVISGCNRHDTVPIGLNKGIKFGR